MILRKGAWGDVGGPVVETEVEADAWVLKLTLVVEGEGELVVELVVELDVEDVGGEEVEGDVLGEEVVLEVLEVLVVEAQPTESGNEITMLTEFHQSTMESLASCASDDEQAGSTQHDQS